jgi:Ca2+-binding EF-hand superfamily protein
MSYRTALLAVLALVLSLAVGNAADEKGKKREKNIDPVLAQQLRAIFDQLDKDKDGYLDKAELAHAFRGPAAKPAPDIEPADDNDKKPAKPNNNTPVYTDAVFLHTYDADKDDKLSFEEFEDAGMGYSKQAQKGIDQAQKADLQALKRFRNYQLHGGAGSPLVGPWEAFHRLMRMQAAQSKR